MRVTRVVAVTILFIAISYIAYPYATLYRLGTAIQTGNAQTLQTLVDWSSVRQGIKHDVGDAQYAKQPADELPAFGSSFVRNVASNTIDQRVTPQGLVAATHRSAVASGGANVHVGWAFFDDPTHFVVSLQAGNQITPIRLELSLQDMQWKVTRVWLPPSLLDQANSRT